MEQADIVDDDFLEVARFEQMRVGSDLKRVVTVDEVDEASAPVPFFVEWEPSSGILAFGNSTTEFAQLFVKERVFPSDWPRDSFSWPFSLPS